MRFRNDTGDPMILATEPNVPVAAGEVVDHNQHIAGLTPLDDEPDPANQLDPGDTPVPELAAPIDEAPADRPAKTTNTKRNERPVL